MSPKIAFALLLLASPLTAADYKLAASPQTVVVVALPDRTVYSITGASLNRDWPAKSAGVVAALQLQQKFGPGQRSLRPALCDYVSHFHAERNHQGEDNVILFPEPADRVGKLPVRSAPASDSQLAPILNYYREHEEGE